MAVHLTEENLRTACDVLTTRGSWAVVSLKIGCSENLLYNWLHKSRKAEADREGEASPFWLTWRDSAPADYWHNHVKHARRDNILSLEAVMRDQVRNGLSEPIYDGNGAAVFLQDAQALADWEGDAAAARALGVHDPFFAHDENGARIQARRTVQVPASLRQKVLAGLIPAFADSSQLNVAMQGRVVHVMTPPVFVPRAALSGPAPNEIEGECTEVIERPDIAQLRAEHAAAMAKPLNERRTVPEGIVKNFDGQALNVGRKPAPIDDMPDDAPLPGDPLGEYEASDHPRAYAASTPAPPRPPRGDYPAHSDPRGRMAMKVK